MRGVRGGLSETGRETYEKINAVSTWDRMSWRFFFFRLAGIMEGWSLLLQESPCLMEAGMAGWRADEGEEEVDGKGNSRSTAG